MNELTPSYNPLQYLLLFLAKEDGWFEKSAAIEQSG
jgi:hypothetical protein